MNVSITSSHLFPANRACSGNMIASQSCSGGRTFHQKTMTVLAYLFFHLRRYPDPVSHPDFPGKLHIPVAALRICFEFIVSKLKKPVDALICHVLCPVFLFLAHDSSNERDVTNRCLILETFTFGVGSYAKCNTPYPITL